MRIGDGEVMVGRVVLSDFGRFVWSGLLLFGYFYFKGKFLVRKVVILVLWYIFFLLGDWFWWRMDIMVLVL